MDQQLNSRLEALEKKIDATYASAEKTRKYILSMVVATVVTIVLPMIALLFAVPALMSTYAGMGEDMTNLGI